MAADTALAKKLLHFGVAAADADLLVTAGFGLPVTIKAAEVATLDAIENLSDGATIKARFVRQ